MTPSQLSDLLNRQAESFCKFLFPNGRYVGREWVVGSLDGEAGQSLKIVVAGDKVGVWSDFHTQESGGDLLDLWMKRNRCGIAEAMRDAAGWAGIVLDDVQSKPQKDYKRPERPRNARRLNPEGRIYRYLTNERRLTPQTLEDYQVAEQDDQWILFPYKRDNALINTKYLHVDRNEKGKKVMRQEAGAEQCLYGWDALRKRYPMSRMVVLVEGEVDCMTVHQYGYPALSIPNGVSNHDWIENDYDRLELFDTLYLCMDSDKAGQEATKELLRRIGSARCRVIQLPFKDPNDCLLNEIDDFGTFILKARSIDPEELKPAGIFLDKVIDKFYPKPGSYHGMTTPWPSMSQILKFQRSELIIWTGFSGSGKSTVLNQVVINGLQQNERFAICSLEMKNDATLAQMVRQMTGERCPFKERITQAIHRLNNKVWIVDIVGKMKTERILEVFKYAVKRYNIKNFVLDSLTKCNIREDDYDAQKEFIDALCDFNHQYDCTTHLVVHQRKPSGGNERPDKFGARGAAAITDEANTVISVWRPNKNRNEPNTDRFKGKAKSEPTEEADTVLFIDKNRANGMEGRFDLYFEPESLQFHETRQPSINYLEDTNPHDDGTF